MSNDPTVNADTADTEPLHNPSTNTVDDHTDPPDTGAELARWKQLARKHEDRAKANAEAAKELERIKAASMTELERAVNDAKAQTRADVLREVGATRVADQVRIAAASRLDDDRIAALLDGMNPTRFMDDDGQPDVKAIKTWVDQIAPPSEPAGVPRVPFGVRDPGKTVHDPVGEFTKFISNQLNPS